MYESSHATIAAWSYALAAAGYVVFAIRMAFGWRRSVRATLLLGATLATALWAGAGIALALSDSPVAWLASNLADSVRYAVWFVFLASLLRGEENGVTSTGATALIPRWAMAVVAAGLVASVVLSEPSPVAQALGVQGPLAEFGIRLGLAVFGLLLVEQLIRRLNAHHRWSIKPLCLGLAGVFFFDLFFYADAMLYARLDADIFAARGIANALVIPFIAVATARNTGWTVDMHLSRTAVFRSTALLVSGGFLLAVAGAGYIVRFIGGDWGRALQIEVFFAAALLLVLVASSGRFRAKLKVFVSKHFFSYRYDYREEWLRFTRTLSTESSVQGVNERTIMALANLVESPAGVLWLAGEGGGFRPGARWNLPAVNAVEPAASDFVKFLERTGWVVSVHEYAVNPARYSGLTMPPWLSAIHDAWLIVPLASGVEMLGFVVLVTPRAAVEFNWEVRDMLKTASRQAASYIGQLRATEALLETRKFDAFNRMSAFVVHDLKNLVSQLSLMLRNAERHRDNLEFQRDMLTTVEHVVGRMNNLMLQLRTGATPVENARLVELESVVKRACAAKTGDERTIGLDLASGVATYGHEDRFEHMIAHLIQNALDATDADGHVSVRLTRDERFAVIEVADTGKGMSPEFVRDRLFKPFETTKSTGMGIGVYESMQYIQTLGGQMLVDSTPNLGTRIRVLLPIADNAVALPPPHRVLA
ncbi:MAG: XrtA/PEP-CTERM system histidine kinase PrsK [Casimicrobiaceae bacterium]